MSQQGQSSSEAAGNDSSDREELRKSLAEQRARVSRLREAGAAEYELRPALKGLESLLRSVITEQGLLVRRLRADRDGKEWEEAVVSLQALMVEFQEIRGVEIEDQRARVTKLREDGGSPYDIRTAVSKLRSLLSELILAQLSLLMELRSIRADKSVIAEAERRLTALKAEFLADTGGEWSDVREEGPVLLTTNQVRGSEVLPELKLQLKQLRRKNVLR